MSQVTKVAETTNEIFLSWVVGNLFIKIFKHTIYQFSSGIFGYLN